MLISKSIKEHFQRITACAVSLMFLSGTLPSALAGGMSTVKVPAAAMPKSVRKAISGKAGTAKHKNDKAKPLSSAPSDAELVGLHLFKQQLAPMHIPAVHGENSALAKAISDYRKSVDRDNSAPLRNFTRQHPKSRWNAAVYSVLGDLDLQFGHLTDCLHDWHAAWEQSKDESTAQQKAIADHAISQFILVTAKLGRTEELKNLLAMVSKRTMTGSSEATIHAAKEGLSCMQKTPEISFKCGPHALSAILSKQKGKPTHNPVLMNAASTQKGTSLAQLTDWAKEVGLDYQAAKRSPGAELLVPSVMHLTLGHFIALVDRSGDKVNSIDQTFGRAGQMKLAQATIDSESDGYFLVPAGKPSVEILNVSFQQQTSSNQCFPCHEDTNGTSKNGTEKQTISKER